MVYYERADVAGPKKSDYFIAETSDPEVLKAVLSKALGVRGVVRKKRRLYLVGQTRIHIDEVEGLGAFLELEVVLRRGESVEYGQKIAEDLMAKLGIKPGDLIDGAYIDLLERP